MSIPVAPGVVIDEADLSERFIRASGPGGQNVNKVATAVQLRFDTARLPASVRVRLRAVAGRRMTADGEVIIEAKRFRTLERNRGDARARLVALLAQAAIAPKARRATRPTLASKRRRLEDKRRRGAAKARRRSPGDE